jgi:hypothetical protein
MGLCAYQFEDECCLFDDGPHGEQRHDQKKGIENAKRDRGVQQHGRILARVGKLIEGDESLIDAQQQNMQQEQAKAAKLSNISKEINKHQTPNTQSERRQLTVVSVQIAVKIQC